MVVNENAKKSLRRHFVNGAVFSSKDNLVFVLGAFLDPYIIYAVLS